MSLGRLGRWSSNGLETLMGDALVVGSRTAGASLFQSVRGRG